TVSGPHGVVETHRKAAVASNDPKVAALFYWQMRFWSYASAQYYAAATAYLTSRTAGPGEPIISPNLGGPRAHYLGLRQGTELQTLIRAGALSGFIGEAFLQWADWCDGQHISAIADWAAGNLEPHGLTRRIGGVHPNRGSGAQK